MLVTGASKGIGKAIALTMAQSGARGLVLLARSSLSSAREECLTVQRSGHPLQVLSLQVDIADNNQVQAAAKEVKAAFGRLDIVINNAGYVDRYNLIADTDTEDWWRVWNINLRGLYHVTRAFLPLLIECGGDKTFVNVASISALVMTPQYSAYSVCPLALMSGS